MKSALLLSALLMPAVHAGELTIKSAPLETTLELDALFIPANVTVFKIEAKQWTQFTVSELVAHGSTVTKGDPVLAFESEDYQRQLTESQEAAKGRKIAFAKAERELADVNLTTPRNIEGLKLARDRAEETLDYFTQTGRTQEEEDAKEGFERAKRSLSYQEEELKQLLKMYEDDGITEETEEIILKRQRASVQSARFSLKKAEQSSAWALARTIPRQAVDLKRVFDDALLAYETGLLNIPRSLDQKTLALAQAKRTEAQADQDLSELEADGQFFTLKAPSDGVIYFGEINDSSWSLGGTGKFLFKSGTAPSKTILMSLIPTGTPLTLQGSVGQSDRLKLPADAKGTASVDGVDGSAYPVEVGELDIAPNAEGRYGVALNVELPEGSPIVTGMKAKAKLITYRNEMAISVPKIAVTMTDGKSTIKLKMADGKHESHEVKTGRTVHDLIEILDGLEVDQVIFVPEATK